jgi:tRNA-2-methylthio-N6-dimethylallyladenosine synthase
MARHENICKNIHLPAQSGNSRILELMNRGYTREWYLKKVKRIREVLGARCGLSTDMITGFCSETESEHQETLSLMEEVKFDFAYMFTYSERPGTTAEKKYRDDVADEIKKRRLDEIISLQTKHSFERNQPDVGLTYRVLAEGPSKRSAADFQGRNTANKVVVFPKENTRAGEYVTVKIEEARGGTLIGKIIQA